MGQQDPGRRPGTVQALQTMTPAQQFSTIADLAGLRRSPRAGVPRAKADQCLANGADANQLVR
jgi:hypothetical protein